AQARRGEAQVPHLISRRRASKRRRLGAHPSPGAGRFGRAPGLYPTIISLSLSWNAEFKQEGTGVTLLQMENEGRNHCCKRKTRGEMNLRPRAVRRVVQ
ncbi:hypothetical protein BHM03_00039781, partial [Ensete ventricosum]